MKPVDQDLFFDQALGSRGNCLQAAVASVLDLDLAAAAGMKATRIKEYAGRPNDSISYWKVVDDHRSHWMIHFPDESGGMLGNLSGHQIIEHEDGTITATPSILVHDGGSRSVHGFLTKGEWQQA